MAEGNRAASRGQGRASSPNWLASLVGAVFLIAAGFALGLVVGVAVALIAPAVNAAVNRFRFDRMVSSLSAVGPAAPIQHRTRRPGLCPNCFVRVASWSSG